jgi:hypothetical protein
MDVEEEKVIEIPGRKKVNGSSGLISFDRKTSRLTDCNTDPDITGCTLCGGSISDQEKEGYRDSP